MSEICTVHMAISLMRTTGISYNNIQMNALEGVGFNIVVRMIGIGIRMALGINSVGNSGINTGF